MTEIVEVAPLRANNNILRFIKSNIRQYALLLSLLVLMIYFEISTNGVVFLPLNLTNLVLQNSYIVIMALGMLLVIVAGQIDLSVGSVSGFVGALSAVLMVTYKLDIVSSVVICIAVGAAIGGAQGYLIAYYRIPSFIVTLAGMLVFKGLELTILGGASVGPFPRDFQLLSAGFIPSLLPGSLNALTILLGVLVTVVIIYFNFRERRNQQAHGLAEEPRAIFTGRNALIALGFLAFTYQLASYKGLPNVLIVMFALIVLYSFVTTNSTIGRRVYALGGNEKATKLSGIKTERLTFLTFVNMGVLAGLAGLVFAARLNIATPKAGQGFELEVIAACFIGGAATTGGVGTVIGAVVGAFMIGVMNNGMSILGVGIDLQQVIKGVVLMIAVFLDTYYKNKG